MVSKNELIEILRQEMNRQRAIWNKYAGRVINPDNSPQYSEAKKAFDDAGEKMRLLDLEIARLIAHQGEYDPELGDRVASHWQRMRAGTDPQQKGGSQEGCSDEAEDKEAPVCSPDQRCDQNEQEKYAQEGCGA